MIYNKIYFNNLNGYWSPVTSSIDWCEENFIVTKYIAEFWNTISNGIYIILALVGMWYNKKYHNEQRFFWENFGLLCVGIGSWLFHMTLKYQMELADELPMIYTACIAIFCIFELSNDKTYRPYITSILWIIALLFTIMYTEIISLPWFQHSATAFLIAIIVFRTLYVINKLSNEAKIYNDSSKDSIMYPILLSKSKYSKSWISNKKHFILMKLLLTISAMTYIIAFLLWNIDNFYCINLINLRNKFKYISFLFQFHALWHIFTGIGTYSYFIFNLYLKNLLSGHDSTRIQWFFHLIPYVAHDNKKNYNL